MHAKVGRVSFTEDAVARQVLEKSEGLTHDRPFSFLPVQTAVHTALAALYRASQAFARNGTAAREDSHVVGAGTV